jgi:thiamine biosynthesis protein ThiS
MQQSGQISVNGSPMALEQQCSLEAFLMERGLPPRSVVVEHKGEAVAPSEFGGRLVTSGDRLEIVRIVAGG